MSITVTRTKIVPPRRRSDLLTRRRLLNLLDDLLDHTLTMIVAPAGYGKTSLLIDVADHLEYPVCWYAIDPLDEDLQRFIAHFITAIQVQFPQFGKQSMAVLNNWSSSNQRLDQLVTTIVNEAYDTIQKDFVLVLDDYQHVNDHEHINRFVSQFIQHTHEYCHIAIASRSLLSLPKLPLLVAQRQVAGLGLKELVFQPDEIKALILQNYHETISDQLAERLATETEGWITGLLLSAQSKWAGMTDQQRLARVSGIGLYDYLAEQVLSQQAEYVQRFLIRTSIFEEFNAELCRAVFGAPSAHMVKTWSQLIELVLQQNLFVQLIDDEGRWLRYHQLFRDFLQSRLAKTEPVERVTLLHRLGEVYIERGEWEKAHDAYRRLGDDEATADMIVAAGPALTKSGRFRLLERWIEELPPKLKAQRPALQSLSGNVSMVLGNVDYGLDLLRRSAELAAASGDIILQIRTLVRRSAAYRFQGDFQTALADAVDALTLLEEHDGAPADLHAEALRAKGICLGLMGKPQDALHWLERSLQEYEELNEPQSVTMLLMELGLTHMNIGHYATALRQYNRALDHWRSENNTVWQATLLNNLGVLYHLQGEYVRANSVLEEGLQAAWQSGYTRMETTILASIGDLYADLDAPNAAAAAYDEARSTARRIDGHSLLLYLDIATALLALNKGDTTAANQLLTEAEERLQEQQAGSEHGMYALAAGRLAFQQGDFDTAQTYLNTAVERFRESDQPVDAARSHLYLAHVFHIHDDDSNALDHLADVFDIAAGLETWHPLVTAGRNIHTTLIELQENPNVAQPITQLLEQIEAFECERPVIHQQLRQQVEAVPFEPPALTIHAFGTVSVYRAGTPITTSDWQSQTARDLFFCLLEHPDGLTKEEIGTILWPDHSPEKLKSIFKKTVYRLRQALDTDTVIYENGVYRFNRDSDYQFDVELFERAYQRAQLAETREEKKSGYREAISIYDGDYLTDINGQWVITRREQLLRQYKNAILVLSELYLEDGNAEAALKYSNMLLRENPCSEEAHRLAMRAYAAIGDRGAVVRQFNRCRQVLREQIDVPPSPQTEDLFERLTGLT